MSAVRAVPYRSGYETRYMLVDEETGEILDDAQGYGFKTARAAHAAWGYKSQTPEQKAEKRQKEYAILSWMRKHPAFEREMEEIALYSFKDNTSITEETVKGLLKAMDLDISGEPFDEKYLLKVWERGPIYASKKQEKTHRKKQQGGQHAGESGTAE